MRCAGARRRGPLDLNIDVFWCGVVQRGRSPFVRVALPSSLMLWLKVYRQMELAYYPWFVLGHLMAARFNILYMFYIGALYTSTSTNLCIGSHNVSAKTTVSFV
jgi:hypothetical protein